MRSIEPLCSKSLRMLISYYQRQLMSENDKTARETYLIVLRKLERDLKIADSTELELIAN